MTGRVAWSRSQRRASRRSSSSTAPAPVAAPVAAAEDFRLTPGDAPVLLPEPISGHFVAQVQLDAEAGGGLALWLDVQGEPAVGEGLSIRLGRDGLGQTTVQAERLAAGQPAPLDPSGLMPPQRYTHTLDGRYSLPFERSALQLRIMRDDATGFLRLSYAVAHQDPDGTRHEGWISLAPVPAFAPPDAKYRVGVLPPEHGMLTYQHLTARNTLTVDRDDRGAGFAVTRRDYHWSGFEGDAVVIIFGDALPRGTDELGQPIDTKLVFWDRANNVPAWHLSPKHQHSYQFVETWDGGGPGCYEPMSDRILRWSRVEVVQDSPVRKVVRWSYVLCDPDYRVPDIEIGPQLPEVEELWTLYPDGTGTRLITDRPKLDTAFRNWHEVLEHLVIADTTTIPLDHLQEPALTLADLADLAEREQSFHPTLGFDKNAVNTWDAFIAITHLKQSPDVFSAFVNVDPIPERLRPYPLQYDIDWHRNNFQFVHWPVETEPYQEAHKTHGTWPAQVDHTALMSAGVWEGIDWTDRYQTGPDGRPFRQWVGLVGLHTNNDLPGVRQRVQDWLHPPTIDSGPAVYDHAQAHYDVTPNGNAVQLTFNPTRAGQTLPPLRIVGWAGQTPTVTVNGFTLSNDALRIGNDGGALLIDGSQVIDRPTTVQIQK